MQNAENSQRLAIEILLPREKVPEADEGAGTRWELFWCVSNLKSEILNAEF